MKRPIPAVAIVILALTLIPRVSRADPFIEKGLRPAAVLIRDERMDTFNEVRRIVGERGGRGLLVFPPTAIFGRFAESLDASDFSGLPVTVVASPAELAPGMCDPVIYQAILTVMDEREILGRSVPHDDERFRDLVLGIPDDVRKEIDRKYLREGPRTGSPREIVARSIHQNAEFLIGTVLVNVIFPESGGTGEDWTEEELGNAISDIALGLSQYQQKANWVDLNFIVKHYKDVLVSIEPIEGDWNWDPIWISDAMNALEVDPTGSYIGRVHDFNNDTRTQLGADWVFTSFVVDASDNGCWRGPDGYYVAYTISLGGPFTVVPYPACRFGKGVGFAHVYIHEMSHVFYALDEYMVADPNLAYWDCNAHSGYLAIPNLNTLIRQCQEVEKCIMNNASLDLPLDICPYTLGQVGLWDDNENSIPDLYEIAPSIAFLDVPGVEYDTVLTNGTVIAARARNDAVPNQNPNQSPETRVDYAPWLVKGTYWINNGLDTKLIPSDREWDESREDIGFVFAGLSPGLNVFNLEVENSVGLTAQAAVEIYYIGIKYEMITARVETESIDVSWKTAAEVFGAQFDLIREDFTDGSGEIVLATIDTATTAGTSQNHYEYRDYAIAPGHDYRYHIVARFDIEFRGEMRHFEFSSQSISKTALLPVNTGITSVLFPNPTSESTTFTVKIPKSYSDPDDESRMSRNGTILGAPAALEVMTPVDIAVYNVLGQRIKTIYSRKRFGGLEIFKWNGLDNSGTRVGPGVYFIHVVAGGKSEVKKAVVIY